MRLWIDDEVESQGKVGFHPGLPVRSKDSR